MRSMNVLRSRWGAIAAFVVVTVVATTTSVGGANVAEGSCTATRSGDSVLLEFAALTERSFVRRDGNWLATLDVGTSSYVDGRAPDDASYLVRTRPDNVVVDISCTEAVDDGPGDGGPAEAEPVCTATRMDDTVTLEFDVGDQRPIIRRNGSWLTGLPVGSEIYLDTGAPDGATYLVRTRPGGVLTDISCTPPGEDPVDPVGPFCTAAVGGGSVTLAFDVGDQRPIIRRNGSWLTSLPVGSTSFTDTGAPDGATYLVRTRPGGVLTDIGCTPPGENPVAAANRVIHISIDGLRSDHVTPELTPRLSMMMSDGASTLNARTDPAETRTLPNHTAQFTGRFVEGVGGHRTTFNEDNGLTVHDIAGTYVPSVFDVVHDNGGSTILYAGKEKFEYLERTYSVAGAPDVTGEDDGEDKIDTFVRNNPVDAVAPFISDVMAAGDSTTYGFFHIRLPDQIGHLFNWGSLEYQQSVRDSDQIVGQLIDGLVQTGAMDSTTIIVTSDHGGPFGGLLHADSDLADNYTIPFIAWGAGVGEGIDLYDANTGGQYQDPGTASIGRTGAQPIRGHDTANLGLQLLGLPALPSPAVNSTHTLNVN